MLIPKEDKIAPINFAIQKCFVVQIYLILGKTASKNLLKKAKTDRKKLSHVYNYRRLSVNNKNLMRIISYI